MRQMLHGERAIIVRTMPRKQTNKVVLAARVSEAEFKALRTRFEEDKAAGVIKPIKRRRVRGAQS